MPSIDVPAGHLATIVTDLEMRERPALRPVGQSPLRIVRWAQPDPEKYRVLFRRVGEPWLWFSRLAMADSDLTRIIQDPQVEVYAIVDRGGIEVGLLELDRREPPDTEIKFFALVPELTGKGHGRWLMANALNLAWSKGTECVWLHTCTLDHPSALGFYIACGFKPVARNIETFPDPRLSNLIPRDAAPHIPLLES